MFLELCHEMPYEKNASNILYDLAAVCEITLKINTCSIFLKCYYSNKCMCNVLTSQHVWIASIVKVNSLIYTRISQGNRKHSKWNPKAYAIHIRLIIYYYLFTQSSTQWKAYSTLTRLREFVLPDLTFLSDSCQYNQKLKLIRIASNKLTKVHSYFIN